MLKIKGKERKKMTLDSREEILDLEQSIAETAEGQVFGFSTEVSSAISQDSGENSRRKRKGDGLNDAA